MKVAAGLWVVLSMMLSWGCSTECECICQCVEAGAEQELTVTVAEEGDCKGECEGFAAETCPNATSEGFSVDCS